MRPPRRESIGRTTVRSSSEQRGGEKKMQRGGKACTVGEGACDDMLLCTYTLLRISLSEVGLPKRSMQPEQWLARIQRLCRVTANRERQTCCSLMLSLTLLSRLLIRINFEKPLVRDNRCSLFQRTVGIAVPAPISIIASFTRDLHTCSTQASYLRCCSSVRCDIQPLSENINTFGRAIR